MSTGKIKLAEGLVLPENAATQVYAFLGKRGSGKTYGAGRLVEQLLDTGNQVVILDPVGAWWGLRLAANGTDRGYEIPLFGGIHGEIPLVSTAGEVVAELVAQHRTSLILDVSEFTGGEQARFVADFATALFHAKKRHRSRVLVLFDEAQDFCPQQPEPGEARMLGAVQRLAKLGRNFGIGVALLSQRPQEVAKKVLNLSEVLLAFQLGGTHERKAISDWVKQRGEEGRADVGDELPALAIGTAMVWSPQWLKIYGKFEVLPKWTFDSSATPDETTTTTGPLPTIDLVAVRRAMAATIEEVKQNDPQALREEVASLRSQLQRQPTKVEAIEIPVLLDDERQAVKELGNELRDGIGTLIGLMERAAAKLPSAAPVLASTARIDDRPAAVAALERRVRQNPKWGVDRERPKPSASGAPSAALEVLRELACMGGRARKRQLATLAGFKPTVSTLRNYMSLLRVAGYIRDEGVDEVVITASGAQAAGPARPARTPAELLALWIARLPTPAGRILSFFAAEHGPFTNEVIQRRCNVPPGKSTLRNYMSMLRTNGLIERSRGGHVVNPLLKH